jgi:hypothetical protein
MVDSYFQKRALSTERIQLREQVSATSKALLIGINYRGDNRLDGTLDDIISVYQFLTQKSTKSPCFNVSNVKLSLEKSQNANNVFPTKENIKKSIEWLGKDIGTGDSVYIHYSGHGERKVSMDLVKGETVSNQELSSWIQTYIPSSVYVVAVFDSCHSENAIQLNGDRDWMLISAAAHKKKATDGVYNEINSGLLTFTLLQVLSVTYGLNYTIQEVFKAVREIIESQQTKTDFQDPKITLGGFKTVNNIFSYANQSQLQNASTIKQLEKIQVNKNPTPCVGCSKLYGNPLCSICNKD